MKQPLRHVRFCAWGGPILLIALILFWGLLGHNIPPYSAAGDAQEIADHFRNHTAAARAGMILSMAFGAFYLVWGLGVTKLMEHIETDSNVLSQLQLWGAGLTTLIIILPCGIWLTAAFRPHELDPQIIQLLYDLGWIIFDASFSVTALQILAMGICFLTDKRPVPLVPTWVGWYTVWVGAMLPLLGLIAVFKGGPFARDGMINYWIEFPIFFLFMLLTSIYVLRALPRLERELEAEGRS